MIYMGLSLLGLVLLAPLTFNPLTPHIHLSNQGLLTSSIFILICLSGIAAGVAPSRLRVGGHAATRRRSPTRGNAQEGAVYLRGHHPACERFDEHVINLNGRVYCAGCTGLVTGAVLAVLGSFFFLFGGYFVGFEGVLFWLGFVWVALGIIQHHIDLGIAVVHLALNTVFVVGAFLLFVDVQRLSGNLIVEAYLLALTVFWIMSRIHLSRLDHERICRGCGLKSCTFSFI